MERNRNRGSLINGALLWKKGGLVAIQRTRGKDSDYVDGNFSLSGGSCWTSFSPATYEITTLRLIAN